MTVKTLRISENIHKIFLKYQGLLQAQTGETVDADKTLETLLQVGYMAYRVKKLIPKTEIAKVYKAGIKDLEKRSLI